MTILAKNESFEVSQPIYDLSDFSENALTVWDIPYRRGSYIYRGTLL